MIKHIREMVARRRGEEFDFESGFTLIELLIVIVVLGILAATVVFALTGVSGQSATAACQSDGKSYEVAVAAYVAQNNGSNPTSTSALVPTYLHAAANNGGYIVAITGDTVTGTSTGVTNGTAGTKFPTTPAPTAGEVFVGVPGGTLNPFDSSGSCNGV